MMFSYSPVVIILYLELLFFSLTFGLMFSNIGWDKLQILFDLLKKDVIDQLKDKEEI